MAHGAPELVLGWDKVEVMLREAAVTPSKLPESVLHYVEVIAREASTASLSEKWQL
ncbi:MAG TPA: hypothetical protein VF207_02215 [Chthoniobacterales bacterium]